MRNRTTLVASSLVWTLLASACNSVGGVHGRNALPAPIEEVILLDVQGLFGGWDVWVSSEGDAFSRTVTPPGRGDHGLQEVRYRFALSDDDRAALFDLIREHDFLDIMMRDRPGIPDETRPAIYVKTADTERLVSKWARVDRTD
jgi:hypothetical protein